MACRGMREISCLRTNSRRRFNREFHRLNRERSSENRELELVIGQQRRHGAKTHQKEPSRKPIKKNHKDIHDPVPRRSATMMSHDITTENGVL
jgi:hypothetical protein